LILRNILLGLGILAVLAGILLAVLWFRQPVVSAAVVKPIPTELVLVASHAIIAGVLLRPGDVTLARVVVGPESAADIVEANLADAHFIGAVTRRSFQAAEPLSEVSLIRPGDSEFLISALRPGYRAVSIAVDATQSGAGLVLPGDRVDIILTQSLPSVGTDVGHKSVGETVLRDLRVIAVDQTLVAVAKPVAPAVIPEPRMPKTITLEVTARQAEIVLVAEQLGKIQLSLLGRLDQEATPPLASEMVAPPVWASDVSPALTGTASSTSAVGQGPIEVMHGAKTERRCAASGGLITCP